MNNYLNINTDINHILSSFIGGISFIFLPKQTNLAYALTISSELLWWQFIRQNKNSSKFVNRLSKIDVSRFIVVLGMALMLHLYVFHNQLINNLGVGLANAATNQR